MHGRAACPVWHFKHGGRLSVGGQVPIVTPEAHGLNGVVRFHYKAHVVPIFVVGID
jgi:hypothetical protein